MNSLSTNFLLQSYFVIQELHSEVNWKKQYIIGSLLNPMECQKNIVNFGYPKDFLLYIDLLAQIRWQII